MPLSGKLKPDSQVVRYFWVSVLSGVLSLGLPVLFHRGLGVHEEPAVACSLAIVFLTNFFTIRVYAFRSRGSVPVQFIKFAVSSGVFRVGEFLLFVLIFRYLGAHYLVALVAALGVSFVVKYQFQKRFVFV